MRRSLCGAHPIDLLHLCQVLLLFLLMLLEHLDQRLFFICLQNAQASFSLHYVLSLPERTRKIFDLLPEKCNPEQDFGCTREDTRKAAEILEGMAELGPEVWSSLKG